MTQLQKEAVTTILNLVSDKKVSIDDAIGLIEAIISKDNEYTTYYPYSPNTITYTTNTVKEQWQQ